jgi:hypothetical protein
MAQIERPDWARKLTTSFCPIHRNGSRRRNCGTRLKPRKQIIVEDAERNDVCSICGDDPAQDYRLEEPFQSAGGVDTLKLCEDCFEIRRDMSEPFEVI